jgi:hypothetical protein
VLPAPGDPGELPAPPPDPPEGAVVPEFPLPPPPPPADVIDENTELVPDPPEALGTEAPPPPTVIE